MLVIQTSFCFPFGLLCEKKFELLALEVSIFLFDIKQIIKGQIATNKFSNIVSTSELYFIVVFSFCCLRSDGYIDPKAAKGTGVSSFKTESKLFFGQICTREKSRDGDVTVGCSRQEGRRVEGN